MSRDQEFTELSCAFQLTRSELSSSIATYLKFDADWEQFGGSQGPMLTGFGLAMIALSAVDFFLETSIPAWSAVFGLGLGFWVASEPYRWRRRLLKNLAPQRCREVWRVLFSESGIRFSTENHDQSWTWQSVR